MTTLTPIRTPGHHTPPILRQWKAHSDLVQGLVVSPDGKQVYSASEDKKMFAWDPLTGEMVRQFKGHKKSINHLALTPNGDRIISASDDNTLRIWSTLTGKTVHILRGHTGYVSRVGIGVQGERLIAVSASKDTTVRVWDVETGDCLHVLEGHTRWVSSLAVSADGTRAVTASEAHETMIWDLVSGAALTRPDTVPSGHERRTAAMAMLSDGSRVVSVEHQLCVLSLTDPSSSRAITPRNAQTYSGLSLSAGGERAALLGFSLEVWDIKSEKRLALQAPPERLESAAFSPDGTRLFTADSKGNLAVWDMAALVAAGEPEGHLTYVGSLHLSGDRVVTGGSDAAVITWNLTTGLPRQRYRLESPYVEIFPDPTDPTRFFTTEESILAKKQLRMWHLDEGEPRLTLTLKTEPGVVVVSPDGKRVFTFDSDGAACIELADGARTPWRGKAQYVKEAVWDSTGRWVLSSNHFRDPSAVPLWSLSGAKRAKTYAIPAGSRGHSRHVAFSPDEKTIVAGWSNGKIYTWARSSRKLLHHWQAHHHFSALFFRPDGQLVTFCGREPIRRWDLEGNLLAEVAVPWRWGSRYAFSADRTVLVVTEESAGFVVRVNDGEQLGRFAVPDGHEVYKLAVTDDGQTVVLGLKAGSVVVLRPS